MPDAPPLILTLRFDEDAFRRFDDLRRRHFPPERNVIPAHATLFHHLPGAQEPAVAAALAARCRGQAPFPVTVAGLRFLGRGVAFTLAAPALEALRADLAAAWGDWLGAQDRQRYRPHVTIQNKVAPATAKALHAELERGFMPFQVRAEGLLLWRYRGGPWEAAGVHPFAGAGDAPP